MGGVVGAVAGTGIDPPPQRVVTYVESAPAPTTTGVVVKEKIVVGKPVPEAVVLTPVPDSPKYAYAIVGEQRVIVDPQPRTVVQVVRYQRSLK